MLKENHSHSLDQSESVEEMFSCCSKQILVENRGHIVCSSCGMVFQQSIVNQFPRIYADHLNRLQNKALLNDKCQRTIINIHEVDKNDIAEWARKAKHNYWYANDCKSINHKQRFSQSCSNLQHVGINLSLDVKGTAWSLLEKVSRSNYIRGHNLEAMIKACIYVASQIQHQYLLLNDLATDPGDLRRIFVCMRAVNMIKGSLRMERVGIPELINQLGNRLGVKMVIKQKAINLYNLAVSKGLITQGKKTSIMAGSFLYISAMNEGERIEQKKISQLTKATEITLREDVKNITELIEIKKPKNVIDQLTEIEVEKNIVDQLTEKEIIKTLGQLPTDILNTMPNLI